HVRKSRLRTPQGACPSARIIKKHHHEKCGRTQFSVKINTSWFLQHVIILGKAHTDPFSGRRQE
ncbi:hypothetical protein, partial [Acetobacter aceti]|uniref:hypothetical protein n=1 Tax=Acetobacter aceti TaxID=435 RepID=UPI001A9CBA46